MEHVVLKVLRFEMGPTTPLTFLERFIRAAPADRRSLHLAQYLVELSMLLGERFIGYLPSDIAATAVCLSQYCLGLRVWVGLLHVSHTRARTHAHTGTRTGTQAHAPRWLHMLTFLVAVMLYRHRRLSTIREKSPSSCKSACVTW